MGLGPQDRRKGPLGRGNSSSKGWEVGVGRRSLVRGMESSVVAVTGVRRHARQPGAVGLYKPLKSKFLNMGMMQSAVCSGNKNQCKVLVLGVN